MQILAFTMFSGLGHSRKKYQRSRLLSEEERDDGRFGNEVCTLWKHGKMESEV